MYQDKLVIRGAQQHNLKNVDLALPRHKLIVFTGVSGSGKSSLAFDTLYAEGQRRYVESLSSYARQFLGQMEKPKVDFIGGLSPAIAIEQKAASKNPRSTVGTVTEIYDYLRVLYARVGTPHCPRCGREVQAQSAQQIVDRIAQLPPGARFQVLAPVVRGRKGSHQEVLEQARAAGYVRARIDGVPVELADRLSLARTKKHDIEIVVDRLASPMTPTEVSMRSRDPQVPPGSADHGTAEILPTEAPKGSRDPRVPPGSADPGTAEILPTEAPRGSQAPRVPPGSADPGRAEILPTEAPRGSQAPRVPPGSADPGTAEILPTEAPRGSRDPRVPPGSTHPGGAEIGSGHPGTAESGVEDADFATRLTDSVETAQRLADGLLFVDVQDGEMLTFSEQNACPACGISFPELTPQMFSFNSPHGMCPECNGLGTKVEFDPDLFVDPDKTLNKGGVRTWGELAKKKSSWTYKAAQQIAGHYGYDLDARWRDLSAECQQAILYGGVRISWQSASDRGSWSGEWDTEGVVNVTRRRYLQTKSEYMRGYYTQFMSQQICPICEGKRLRPEALATTLAGRSIHGLTALSIREALAWIESLCPDGNGGSGFGNSETREPDAAPRITNHESRVTNHALSPEQSAIAEEVLKEIRDRLQFMLNVGLHYLTLDRSAPTLSGGEGQRIRLASQIGCGLVGVLYILDEPSIGLHQRDNRRLLDTLEQLRDMGNTVLVVEHDAEAMLTADWIVDLGPGAGALGGWVVAEGTPEQIMGDSQSLTGRYLSGEIEVVSPNGRRRAGDSWLAVLGARQNNLRDLTVRFPIAVFTCVTGVSGSGKSSLVSQTLHPALARVLQRSQQQAGDYDRLEGLETSRVDKVINITQEPIGRTPRSNPATYVGVFGDIRTLFAQVPEAKARGYKPGRFSFNVKGGRCEACSGHGQKKIEMHFLPDVWVTCDVCHGSRFNRETLQIRFKGASITEVLAMDVNEALQHFAKIPKIKRKLQSLADVGLGYVKLGQSATTLSGGEAQRVKLAKELARVATGDTLYILDEPTTGLHFADIQKLLDVLHRLTDGGNTVIVIEHNMDVIKTADWIIDLGPEGGDGGGLIVAQGTPEEVAGVAESYTGQFLQRVL